MKLTRKDLKKILYGFNSISNRLIQADFRDYTDVLKKFTAFLDDTPIIRDYINQCGKCDVDVQNEVQEVRESCGRLVFSKGDSEQEEVRNVYGILKYCAQENLNIYGRIAIGYSESDRYQDKIKSFNDRFVMVLIRHIENYLTRVGIDMDLDERITYNVTASDNGQAILAVDGSTVSATNTYTASNGDLDKLLEAVRLATPGLSDEEQADVSESLEVIAAEARAEHPKRSMLKMALKTLQGITGFAEFVTAVGGLAEFIQPMI